MSAGRDGDRTDGCVAFQPTGATVALDPHRIVTRRELIMLTTTLLIAIVAVGALIALREGLHALRRRRRRWPTGRV